MAWAGKDYKGKNVNIANKTQRDVRYDEALALYCAVLKVRQNELGNKHPDTVATKFSLAELFSVTGNEKESDRLRDEILTSLEEK
mmetsp:Transcript_3950/g.7542  ORF Transcript_3950/g.7542 Transcript_3950/m.7542 type:complete len:85 (+) Transcript_3950:330-584(+)